MAERLCEISDRLRPGVMATLDARTVRMWASLKCPHAGGCDKSRSRCDGMTPQNCQIISELKDKIFVIGAVPIHNLAKE